jgi:hypothetical protein
MTTMKAYKGFNRDMTCRDFQFEEGKTYEEENAKLCDSGFHACVDPLDCFNYYYPGQSVYREVELDDNGERHADDSKVCGKKITIGAEIGLPGIIKAHFDYVKSNCTMERTDPKQATAGDSGAATAGYRGAATAGDSGAATAGYRGAATSRGKVSVGENGVGTVRGDDVMIRGGKGAMLTIAVESKTSFDIVSWGSFVIDGKMYKPDTWYTLRNGEIVEAEE